MIAPSLRRNRVSITATLNPGHASAAKQTHTLSSGKQLCVCWPMSSSRV